MPGNFKNHLRKTLINNAIDELECLNTSDEEVDEVLDDLETTLNIVSSFRYGFRSTVPKNHYWFEQTVPLLDDGRFKILFRVSKAQFMVLLSMIETHKIFNTRGFKVQFRPLFQLALVLYCLGSSGEGGTIGKIASFFGIGDGGTIQRIVARFFIAILDLENIFLQWPGKDERREIISKTMHELPQCVGYLDGTEIPLAEAPSTDPTSYFSRKKQYSIKMQAICDPDLKIRHVAIGFPGSVHDARIFANTEIGSNIERFLSNEEWIAADSAYKLTTTIITPFRRNHTNRAKFNKEFSKYRVKIERCFGFLKEKFGSLKSLRMNITNQKRIKYACTWIRVCCIIYNIILPHWDVEGFDLFSNCELENDEIYEERVYNNMTNNDGKLKREALHDIIISRI